MKRVLKYGLWFSGIYAIFLFVLLKVDDFGLITSIISPGFYPVFLIFQEGMNSITKYIFRIIISVLSWFLLGALIGFIVGKIKKE